MTELLIILGIIAVGLVIAGISVSLYPGENNDTDGTAGGFM